MRLRTRMPAASAATAGTLKPATVSHSPPIAPEAASVATCEPLPIEKHRFSVCTIWEGAAPSSMKYTNSIGPATLAMASNTPARNANATPNGTRRRCTVSLFPRPTRSRFR